MNYLDKINKLYPIRRSNEDKAKFRDYINEEVKKYNTTCNVETLEEKHNNIIIGDIEKAKVIITAHYDTPAASLLPNIMMPRNLFLGFLYHFGYPIMLALFSLLITYLIKYIFNLEYTIWAIMYIAFYLGIYFLCTRTFTNKHNVNDNTSGVATVMDMLSKNNNTNVCYVLFDNEEKGLLGSKAFNNAHKDLLQNKLIINLDCVGDGNNVIIISKDGAIKHGSFNLLKSSLKSNEEYNVNYFGTRGSMANSDYKNFDNGIGVMTCNKNKVVGYYTSRIHTSKDTIAKYENICFISDSLIEFINKL